MRRSAKSSDAPPSIASLLFQNRFQTVAASVSEWLRYLHSLTLAATEKAWSDLPLDWPACLKTGACWPAAAQQKPQKPKHRV
jgi:hypothetical protein